MSHRVASAPLFSGSHVVSPWGGLGIPGSEIPTAGDSGASPLANDEIAATSEYRLEVLTPPTAGTLKFNPDTSFLFSGAPNGAYSLEYEGFGDGGSYGSVTDPITVGPLNATATGAPRSISLTPPAGTASGTAGVIHGNGVGAIKAISLVAPIGSATGTSGLAVNGTAVGSIKALTLSAPIGSATGTWARRLIQHTKTGSLTPS
jgi:hypothetical protein